MKLLLLPIAVASMILTYAASHQVLKSFTALRPPRLIVLMVALLTGLSLLSLGNGVVTLILLPYAALGLTVLVLVLLKCLKRCGALRRLQEFLKDETPAPPRRLPDRKTPPATNKDFASGHLKQTHPPEE